MVRLPPHYFDERHPRLWLNDRHPVLRGLGFSIKNLLGVLFVLAGIAMLVLPGQGLLTMLIGLSFFGFSRQARPGTKDHLSSDGPADYQPTPRAIRGVV